MKRGNGLARMTVRVAVVMLLLIGMRGLASSQDATPLASPVATPAPPAYEVTQYLMASMLPPVGEIASPHIVLTWITLVPGAEVPRTRAHFGSSILYVLTGVVCYNLTSKGEATVNVAAPSAAGGEPAETVIQDCDPPDPACEASCSIENGARVLLQAGDAVIQIVEPDRQVTRGYANAGTETAVVLLAQYQAESESAPCGGGCP